LNQSLLTRSPAGGSFPEILIQMPSAARGANGVVHMDFASPHNSASNANQFLRITKPRGADFIDAIVSHPYRSYQIPNDVPSGEPAATDDNQTQDDVFAAVRYHHAIGDHGFLTFGPAYKRSRIRDLGDPQNDWAYGQAVNIANGGAPTGCADALQAGKAISAPRRARIPCSTTGSPRTTGSTWIARCGAGSTKCAGVQATT
jgi:hypothetical protein